MNIMIFDTETTSLDKPFCYNVGYIIVDSDTAEVIIKRDFVVEQVWHNPMLFTTAYYADKRELYVKSMRSRKTTMDKFGYICQRMIRDIKNFEVSSAYAYNSSFDEKVFDFNCDWFKCNNPFDNIPIYDIRGYAHHFICDDEFKNWCEEHNAFSDSGNYSTTAETAYKFITNDDTFVEEHTALNDSEIEMEILAKCANWGEKVFEYLPTAKCIARPIEKVFTIQYKGKDYHYKGLTAKWYKSRNKLIIK